MSTPLLLPKFEQPAILDELEAHCVDAPEEVQRWNSSVCELHYLGNADMVGEQLRYVVTYQGQWLVLVGWSAASFHLKDRDRWLGWSKPQRRARLHLLAQNSRLVVLPDRSRWPNLATRALALVSQRLPPDWQKAYGHPIAAVESFVDSQLSFRGTAYKASNWKLLGQTDGFGRVAEDFYTRHGRPKQLWVKSLAPDAPALYNDIGTGFPVTSVFFGSGASVSGGAIEPLEVLGLGWDVDPGNPSTFWMQISESQVVAPADMMAIGDNGGALDLTLTNVGGWPGKLHNGGANVLLCDGHVEYAKQTNWVAPTTVARRRWNNDNQPHPETWP